MTAVGFKLIGGLRETCGFHLHASTQHGLGLGASVLLLAEAVEQRRKIAQDSDACCCGHKDSQRRDKAWVSCHAACLVLMSLEVLMTIGATRYVGRDHLFDCHFRPFQDGNTMLQRFRSSSFGRVSPDFCNLWSVALWMYVMMIGLHYPVCCPASLPPVAAAIRCCITQLNEM